jgi:hypothetical protein
LDAWTAVAVFAASAIVVTLAVLAMVLASRASGRCLHGSCSAGRERAPDGEALACPGCPNRAAAPGRAHDGGDPLR